MEKQFLTNYSEQSFLDRIRNNLRKCDSFAFSVSFIKKAGLVLLINDIEAALARGCKGRIITSTYQNFTDIESLRKFKMLMTQYPDFLCHIDYDSFHDESYTILGYHSKGYIFDFSDHSEIIVGSSNITRYALLKNIEWDILIAVEKASTIYAESMAEFEYRWDGTEILSNEIINRYSDRLNYAIERWDMDYDRANEAFKPNYMQRAALKELNRYRAMGIGRAIAICASGSGKTFLSAFDARNCNPRKLLYIVHESSILEKSLETFKRVFGPDVYYGTYTGARKDMDADFLFSTNVLMSRDLELFKRDEFDYIVIDECHHAVADTYTKIIEYFEPEFLLGLTATPERMDNKDVMELFDKNVPFELRLRDAIINDLVVPFHYYGIRDTLVDYDLPKKLENKMLAQIATTEHCAFIRDEVEKHRPEGKLKALVFCRNITHARQMSEALGEFYKTAYLTGRNTVGERMRAYNDLQSDRSDLEMLCSVDILNEGVDLPGVNMVIFLRPTESSTVFIQQLGRGLRKYDNKQYVTVLDFIGNSYKRSVQIALALGSLSENLVLEKRLMIAMVMDNFAALGLEEYGVHISIDELSKEEMRDFLESENFNQLSYLKQDYYNFKRYICSEFSPRHVDYLGNDCAPNLQKFMNVRIGQKKTGCYYNFLKGIEEENLPEFSDRQVGFLKYASSLLPLVRPHEFIIITALLHMPKSREQLLRCIELEIGYCNDEVLNHAIRFMVENGAIEELDGYFQLGVSVDDQFKEHVADLVKYGLSQYNAEYNDEDEFILWHSYSINQVQLKLLKNPGSNQKGTYYYGKRIIIFASLKKDASVAERLAYKDKFISPTLFQWETENNIAQNNLDSLINSDEALVFVRKVSEENGMILPFTYVGKGKLTNPRIQNKVDSATGRQSRTWLFDIYMENELPDYLQYDFGINSNLN